MTKGDTLNKIIKVSLSNLCIVLSGVFVGFLIPKVLGVMEYGYYKIFTLYATYLGLFSFGISEGLYLKYSGITYDNANKPKLRFYTKLFMWLELILSLILLAFSIIFMKNEYKIIFIALSIYMFEINITTYYQFIAQMTFRFEDYSMRNMVKSALTIVSVLIIFLLYLYKGKNNLSYLYYLSSVLIISTILLIMYINKFKDITFGIKESFKSNKDELKELMKLGIPFLVSSMCATLILTIDRQFVSIYFETKEYGIYAFAYNLMSLVTVCTSAISTVLYPTLKQAKKEDIKEKYPLIASYVLCFVFLALCGYFPLCIIIQWALPHYESSLVIFRIVFPGLAFSSVISVVMQNYYKLFNKNDLFFRKNVVILILSAVANLIAYYTFKSTKAISIASIFTILVYYLYVENYFVRLYNVKWKKNFSYGIIMMLLFYIITTFCNIYAGFILYLAAFALISLLYYRAGLRDAIEDLRSKK